GSAVQRPRVRHVGGQRRGTPAQQGDRPRAQQQGKRRGGEKGLAHQVGRRRAARAVFVGESGVRNNEGGSGSAFARRLSQQNGPFLETSPARCRKRPISRFRS